MTMISIGDLAQSLQLRRDNARLSQQLSRLTQELSTGRSSTPDTRLRGDYTVKAALSTDLSQNAALARAVDDFTLETDARQAALETILGLGRDVSTTLLQVSSATGPEARTAAAQSAATRFDAVLQNLNTQLGGRSLFAGQDVKSAAVASSDVILTAIETEITLAGADTPETIEQVIDTWFGSGGAFETIGYLGSPEPLRGLGQDGQFSTSIPTALDPRLRETLAGLTKAAIIDRGVIDPVSEDARDMLMRSSATLLNADQEIVNFRADVGIVQQQNADARTELTTARFSLEQALAELTEVDQFETAVSLEETETQLRTLYSLTAKLSNLSLTDFLR